MNIYVSNFKILSLTFLTVCKVLWTDRQTERDRPKPIHTLNFFEVRDIIKLCMDIFIQLKYCMFLWKNSLRAVWHLPVKRSMSKVNVKSIPSVLVYMNWRICIPNMNTAALNTLINELDLLGGCWQIRSFLIFIENWTKIAPTLRNFCFLQTMQTFKPSDLLCLNERVSQNV